MTIAEFSSKWVYWMPLLAAVVAASWLMRARPFDFSFMVILVLSQFAVHSVLAYGLDSSIAVFCIAFVILFLLTGQERFRLCQVRVPRSIAFSERVSQRWVLISKYYLLIYYSARLALYPFFSGELMLDDRLEAQKDNVLLYVAGVAITPAIAAVMYSVMKPGGRALLSDKLLLLLVAVGMLGAGSKAGLAFLVFTFIGVASYLGQGFFKYKLAVACVAAATVGTVYLLKQFFPDLDLLDIGSLILHRIAANTDSLDYLLLLGQAPQAYPYSGIGALHPIIAKRFGYAFEYPPGVWLHGMRFGNWEGFGPNSGIVMDYFGNLGWFGLLVPVLLGIYFRVCRARPSVIMCSFLSMTYVIVVDIGLFDITWTFWMAVLVVLLVLDRFSMSMNATPKLRRRRAREVSVG